ncbi:MAG: hypothetical protein Q8L86_03945 [Vicinamibacterales bacterium]|nr:hypothetical protein [Vicinamibacterales bacterium]
MWRPERILLLRTGRHLATALHTLARVSPGCEVTVVATPGAESSLAGCGIGPERTLIYDARPQFEAWPFLTSGLYRRARHTGYDRVVVLWLDPHGAASANVDRTAFLLAPGGFEAITPDGLITTRRAGPVLRRQAVIALASLVTLATIHLLLAIPARLARTMAVLRRAPRAAS